jgi:hypothetical protein
VVRRARTCGSSYRRFSGRMAPNVQFGLRLHARESLIVDLRRQVACRQRVSGGMEASLNAWTHMQLHASGCVVCNRSEIHLVRPDTILWCARIQNHTPLVQPTTQPRAGLVRASFTHPPCTRIHGRRHPGLRCIATS